MDASVLSWAEKRSHPRSAEGLPRDTSDGILQHFSQKLIKKMANIMKRLISRYLRESNYEYSMLNSIDF